MLWSSSLGLELVDCPLCTSKSIEKVSERPLYLCKLCRLCFKHSKNRLSPPEEKLRYETHDNTMENQGYIKFLTPVRESVNKKIVKGAKGLDFGCGPGPVLSELLRADGYKLDCYDPYFFPNKRIGREQYEFVTCTEAIEHFYSPQKELHVLTALMEPGAFLFIMTETFDDNTDFESWYYLRDPTHVCFFSKKTFDWISKKYGFVLHPDLSVSDRVFAFEKV